MSNRRKPAAAHTPAGSAAAELRELAAFARRGGPGTPAAGLAADLVVAAELADTMAVRRLAEKAAADPQLAAATLAVIAFAAAALGRDLGVAKAALKSAG